VEALRETKPDRAEVGDTEKALAEANVKAMTMAANFMVLASLLACLLQLLNANIVMRF
jgi:hypothetical protein